MISTEKTGFKTSRWNSPTLPLPQIAKLVEMQKVLQSFLPEIGQPCGSSWIGCIYEVNTKLWLVRDVPVQRVELWVMCNVQTGAMQISWQGHATGSQDYPKEYCPIPHDSSELKPLLPCESSLKLSLILLSVKCFVAVDHKEFCLIWSGSSGWVLCICFFGCPKCSIISILSAIVEKKTLAEGKENKNKHRN